MQNNCNDINTILNLVFSPGDVFEVRCLYATSPGARYQHIESGYFTFENIPKVAEELARIDALGVYFTPNPVHPDLLARSANRFQAAKRNAATTDADILRRRWLLIDCDPKRPSGISASEAEHDAALYKAIEVSEKLKSQGWPEPVMLDSGNGAQLMYRIDLPANDDGLVKACLKALAPMGDDKVSIDQTVFNPSRIWRLPGTWNRKGDEVDDRVYRLAKIISTPNSLEIVPLEKLHELAGIVQSLVPERIPNDTAFYLDAWIAEHCPEAEGPTDWKDGRKWVFPVCPFNEAHDNRSAVILQQANGAIAFKCHHNGCVNNDWYALRELKEPGAYAASAEDPEVDLSKLLASLGCCTSKAKLPEKTAEKNDNTTILKPLSQLIKNFTGLNPPVIHGFLREGETMNIIASPKVGKSWFATRLAVSVASGLDWLGFPVEQGFVLHLDNELFENTLTDRYQKIAAAMNIKPELFTRNVDVLSMRGKLQDIISLGKVFKTLPPDRYKLTILDAFYRTLPSGTDENDNAAIANIYNLIDYYAGYLNCAFVLIHHSSKGSQTLKSITDVGSGAGAQSRAADTHLIIRPHELEDTFVMESAIRSWAPIAPMPLLWRWPLFIPVENVDVTKLLVPGKTGSGEKNPMLAEFVDNCVATYDPCSERSVVYEAQQRYEMPERKAKDNLALAMERELCAKIRTGSKMEYVKKRPGVDGEKGLWVAALLANKPDLTSTEIAEITEV
ncbi:MAG: AAA family ATPase, partial [Victivallaceae bacterium]|nr:AAA family ATPase [Victivallaceae bacterium]